MTRTYDADHILSLLIELYQQEEHFILHQEGKIFARFITENNNGGAPIEFCLSDMAKRIAERLSK